MRLTKENRTIAAVAALSMLMALAVLAAGTAPKPAEALSVLSVGRTQSGLVTSDPLTTGDTSLWTFGGSAVVEATPYSYSEDSSGLHLGVQSNQLGQWSGFYAARGEQAELFHAVMSLPSTSLAANASFNTGLYVQTGGVDVNYVTCGGGVDSGGYWWGVTEATGNTNGATSYTDLWFQWENNQPLTRSCTIVTNGSNLLDVYFDGTLVYSSTTMNLGYQSPFSVFVEVQGTDNTTMHFSTYQDYYATSSPYVTVNGASPGSTVEILGQGGRVLASSQAGLTGPVTLDVASYDMPIAGTIEVTLAGVPLATSSAVQIYGGDVYSVGAAGTGLGTGGVYTSDPGTATVLNTHIGGLTVDLGSGAGSSGNGGRCILGICL